jgi:protein-tyrosine-phosphatase
VAATRGKTLFDGLDLTARYFFDAIDAHYDGSLTYRGIEHRGDMEKHPTVREDVDAAVAAILEPFLGRKKVLFASRNDAAAGQMATAFAEYLGGDRIEAQGGGAEPAEKIDPLVSEVMAEEGIDMAFRTPMSITAALAQGRPDTVVTLGDGIDVSGISGAEVISWEVPQLPSERIEDVRSVRNELKHRVAGLIDG